MINDHWYVAQQIFTLMNSTHHAIQRISSKAQFVPFSKSESVWDDVKREDQASALAKVETKIIVDEDDNDDNNVQREDKASALLASGN